MTRSLSTPRTTRENENTCTHTMNLQIHDAHMYTHILTKFRARKRVL